MTLLTTVFAAVTATVIWYRSAPKSEMKVGILCWLYWGASLMWLVDAVTEYVELGAEFFTPGLDELVNDFYLGLSVVALGLVIWLVVLLVRDPEGKVRAAITRKK